MLMAGISSRSPKPCNRYTVERELGRGGMAIVYLAHDLRHDRLVALKTLRPELLPALGPERFLREIQIAARLQHPNILPLHDSGEVGGMLYYIMPYVEGESLRARLDREGQLRSRTRCTSPERWRRPWPTPTVSGSCTGT